MINKKVVLLLIAIVPVLLLSAYFCNFHDGFSDDSDDWGNFGGYIGGIFGCILSIVTFYYTQSIDKREIRILLLRQIESILQTIQLYESKKAETNVASNYERGTKEYGVSCTEMQNIKASITASFIVVFALAKSYGINDENIAIKDIQESYDIKEIKEKIQSWLSKINI